MRLWVIGLDTIAAGDTKVDHFNSAPVRPPQIMALLHAMIKFIVFLSANIFP